MKLFSVQYTKLVLHFRYKILCFSVFPSSNNMTTYILSNPAVRVSMNIYYLGLQGPLYSATLCPCHVCLNYGSVCAMPTKVLSAPQHYGNRKGVDCRKEGRLTAPRIPGMLLMHPLRRSWWVAPALITQLGVPRHCRQTCH